MTHKMILMSHDFKEVKAMMIAKRKDADVAQVGERLPRMQEVGTSNVSIGPSFDLPFGANDLTEIS